MLGRVLSGLVKGFDERLVPTDDPA